MSSYSTWAYQREKAFKTHPLLICDLTNTRIYFEGIETADLSTTGRAAVQYKALKKAPVDNKFK